VLLHLHFLKLKLYYEVEQSILSLVYVYLNCVVKSLMVVGNHSATEYWDQILNPLCLRFVNFTNIPPSDKHREDVKLELTFLLSGYIGIVSSANSRVALDLFQRLVPLRRNISSILSLYYHYTDLVQLCLTFMTELGKRFLSYLAVEHALEVYHEAINVTKAYALHAYGRVSAEKGAEDDKVQVSNPGSLGGYLSIEYRSTCQSF